MLAQLPPHCCYARCPHRCFFDGPRWLVSSVDTAGGVHPAAVIRRGTGSVEQSSCCLPLRYWWTVVHYLQNDVFFHAYNFCTTNWIVIWWHCFSTGTEKLGGKILAMCTSLATMQSRRTRSTAVPASLPSGACSNTFCRPWSWASCFCTMDARISCSRKSLLPTRYSKSTSGPHSGTPTRETPPLGSLLMSHCCRFLSLNLAPVGRRSIHKFAQHEMQAAE